MDRAGWGRPAPHGTGKLFIALRWLDRGFVLVGPRELYVRRRVAEPIPDLVGDVVDRTGPCGNFFAKEGILLYRARFT